MKRRPELEMEPLCKREILENDPSEFLKRTIEIVCEASPNVQAKRACLLRGDPVSPRSKGQDFYADHNRDTFSVQTDQIVCAKRSDALDLRC